MDIICKHCNATYSIPEHKLPKKEATAKCKRCGAKMNITPKAFIGSPSGMPPVEIKPAVAVATPHDRALLEQFPQMKNFKPAQFNLAEIMKPNKKGSYKTSLNKYKVKILTTVKETLEKMLREDEQVLRVAGGTAYYIIEILFGNGILTMLYNRYAVVATNQRLVMINTNHSMTKIRHYMYQMTYDTIKKAKRGLFRSSLVLTPKMGKRRVFTSMKPKFSTEMMEVITPRLDMENTLPEETGGLPNLCPACFSALGNELNQCSACSSAFKTPSGAALRSLLLPGLGDLYLGHRFLGCFEMLGSLAIWIVALIVLSIGGVEGVTMAAIMLCFYNGLDALLTLHMGKKGYILAKK